VLGDLACSPSYSGGRVQEDGGSKTAPETLSQKNPSQKRASGTAQGVGPEFKPQYHKNKCHQIVSFDGFKIREGPKKVNPIKVSLSIPTVKILL
jgi:hypothetical protein